MPQVKHQCSLEHGACVDEEQDAASETPMFTEAWSQVRVAMLQLEPQCSAPAQHAQVRVAMLQLEPQCSLHDDHKV